MSSYRRGRVNDSVLNELAEILREVKDPRVSEAFISITAVDVTPDLKYAKVYYSTLNGDKKEIQKGLSSAQGFIRKRIAERLNLRITPEFTFIADNSIENGAHISKLLKTVMPPKEEEEKAEEE